jgi:hypothetical protein
VVDRLNVLFAGADKPAAETVREQSVNYYPRHWLKSWPNDLAVPEVFGDEGRASLTRADVFTQAATVETPGEAVCLYVAVCSWGSGIYAQSITRRARVLGNPAAPMLLMRSLTRVRAEGAVAAYAALEWGGEDHLKYFGPAFWTKWLYFGGFEARDRPGSAPLILDSFVATALGWRIDGWRAGDYERYLALASEVGAAWRPSSPLDVVEYSLFQMGKAERAEGAQRGEGR